MKREFTIAWLILIFYIAAVEFLAPLLKPDLDWLRVAGFAYFALIEAWAIGRPKRGDTLSEHLWAFYAGKPARRPLLIGFSFYVLFALIAIPGSEVYVFGVSAAPLSLAAGVACWLAPHLLSRGRLG